MRAMWKAGRNFVVLSLGNFCVSERFGEKTRVDSSCTHKKR
jgi:hypothetical protein